MTPTGPVRFIGASRKTLRQHGANCMREEGSGKGEARTTTAGEGLATRARVVGRVLTPLPSPSTLLPRPLSGFPPSFLSPSLALRTSTYAAPARTPHTTLRCIPDGPHMHHT